MCGRRERGWNAASPSQAVAGDQPGNPALRDPILAGHLRLGAALDDNSGDHQASFRHPPTVDRSPYADVLRHAIRMS